MLSWSRRRGLAYHTAPARWHAGIGIVRGKQPEWIALAQQVVGIDNVIHTRLQTQYNRLRSVRTMYATSPVHSWSPGTAPVLARGSNCAGLPAPLAHWHSRSTGMLPIRL